MNEKVKLMIGIILMALGLTLSGLQGAAGSSNTNDDLIDDIQEYDGSIGPGNALYGLKLAFENIDESFTLNATEKVGKKVAHSRLRIAEAKAELKKKNNEAAKKAFESYKEKMEETEVSISDIKGNDSGLINAQKMIEKHQYVLERLLEIDPDNVGLQNAYNNSLELEDKFEEKTERHIERARTKEGRQILREIKNENKEDDEEDEDLEDSQELKIKAKIAGNDSQIKIKLEFQTTSTDNATISKEILDQLGLSRDNISSLLEIEYEDKFDLKNVLEAEAKIGTDVSYIEFKYVFGLEKTNRTEMVDGIYDKLSSLSQADIQDILEIVVMKDKQTKEDDKERRQEEKEIRKEEVKQESEVIQEERKVKEGNRTED